MPRTSDTDKRATSRWLTEGKLDAETEATITCMQDGVLHTNKYLREVAGSSLSSTCRLCGSAGESIGHILAQCREHQFHLHLDRHNRVLYLLVRTVVKVLGLRVPNSLTHSRGTAWCGVYGTMDIVIKVDVHNPTDRTISHTRPDLVIRLNSQKQIFVLDVTCPWEGELARKEMVKKRKYQALAADLANQSKYTVREIPVAIGVLGTQEYS